MSRTDRFYGVILSLSLFALQYVAMLKKRRVAKLTQLRRRIR